MKLNFFIKSFAVGKARNRFTSKWWLFPLHDKICKKKPLHEEKSTSLLWIIVADLELKTKSYVLLTQQTFTYYMAKATSHHKKTIYRKFKKDVLIAWWEKKKQRSNRGCWLGNRKTSIWEQYTYRKPGKKFRLSHCFEVSEKNCCQLH